MDQRPADVLRAATQPTPASKRRGKYSKPGAPVSLEGYADDMLLKPEEAAEYLRCNVRTVHRFMANGTLPTVRIVGSQPKILVRTLRNLAG